MLLILDSNEYLFGLGLTRQPESEKLLEHLIEKYPLHQIRVPRLISEEVRRNLPPQTFSRFLQIVQTFTVIDEDSVVTFELGARYEAMGLKAADAFIAAYTECVGAEALITENRHFLIRRTDLPFKVLTAEQCLKLL